MPRPELYCPACGKSAEHRGRLRDLTVRYDYYRCPGCGTDTHLSRLPSRRLLSVFAPDSAPGGIQGGGTGTTHDVTFPSVPGNYSCSIRYRDAAGNVGGLSNSPLVMLPV